MKSKKAVMGFAALLVLLFHFYIPVTKSPAENFLYRTSYIGVDLFFLVSACSLGKKEHIDFIPFMKNRLKSVWIPFCVLSVISAVYRKWNAARLLSVVFGIEFFRSGGGSFLWYAPGILMLYTAVPFLVKMKRKFGIRALPFMLAGWFAVCAAMQYGFGYTKMFILLNRLPAFFAGLYYGEITGRISGKKRAAVYLLMLAAGSVLLYRFGTNIRLNVPLKDMYYVLALPSVIAVAGFIGMISEKIRLVPLEFIGGITLELYGLQMIFGFPLETYLLRITGNGTLAFVLVSFLLTGMAFVFSKIMKIPDFVSGRQ